MTQDEATSQLIQWVREGKLKHRETIVEGLENAPAALNQLFDGANIGKPSSKSRTENAPAALNQLFDGANIGKLMVKVAD